MAPMKEMVKERDRFWNDVNRTPDSVGNGYRLCILGDLNGFIGNRTSAQLMHLEF